MFQGINLRSTRVKNHLKRAYLRKLKPVLFMLLILSLTFSMLSPALAEEVPPSSPATENGEGLSKTAEEQASASVVSPVESEEPVQTSPDKAQVVFSFLPEGPLSFEEGLPLSEADLLAGVSATDEAGRELAVSLSDLGGLALSDPQVLTGDVSSYTISYEAAHASGVVFTKTREVRVVPKTEMAALTAGKPMPAAENPQVMADAATVDTEAELWDAIGDAEDRDTITITADIVLSQAIDINVLNEKLKELCISGEEGKEVEITIEAGAEYRHIRSEEGGFTLNLDNLILTGNKSGTSGGGGVNVAGTGSTLIMSNCTVENCYNIDNGGGVYAEIATLTNCTISGNASSGGGGGVGGTIATLTNCEILGNTANYEGSGVLANTATLTNCTVSGNSSEDSGGGVLATTATLTNCTVSGNSAGDTGGGVLTDTATLTDCTVSGNSAGDTGGGVNATTATLTNCTVSGNTAEYNGGGACIFNAVDLTNCTITKNTADSGGGVYIRGESAEISILGSIIAGNTGGQVITSDGEEWDDDDGTPVSPNYNIIGEDDLLEPIFGENGPILTDNGGHTLTAALDTTNDDNPAIGAMPADLAPERDQRGYIRIPNNAGNVCIGAYDTEGIALIVTNISDDVSVVGSLRWCVANSNSGDIITFDPEQNWEGVVITLESALSITKTLTIEGPEKGVKIEIDKGGAYRHFLSYTGQTTLTLNNLTLVGINSKGSGGGGLELTGFDCTLIMNNCTVQNCYTSSYGGGVRAGTATLTDCTISGNTAKLEGGGVNATTATLTNCTVSGNTSVSDRGGGMFAYTATLTNCTVSGNSALISGGGVNAYTATLTNCTVSGNSAKYGGGVLATTATLTNCTVSGNSAGDTGGGVYAGIATLTNCTVSGNSAEYGGAVCAPNAVDLTNCTITKNTADSGGGVYVNNVNATIKIRGSIIAGNTGGQVITSDGEEWDEDDGTQGTQNYNIIDEGDVLLLSVFGTVEPALADNGGPTQTILINPNGPACEGIGEDAHWVPEADQRGEERPQGTFSDIGAVELQAFPLTLNTDPSEGGTITEGTNGSYPEGRTIDLVATPSPGYRFTGWTSDTGGTFEDASSAATTFTMPSNDVTVTASFEELIKYEVIRNFDTFTGSKTVSAAIDAEPDSFVRLLLGEATVDPSAYEITEGSTVITLTEDYLKTFANGTYHFTAEFTDGYAPLILEVNVASTPAGTAPATPKTGENPLILLIGALSLAALIAGAGILIYRRRRMKE